MRQVTLCFLKDPERICLAMKKKGFGMGKWNGVGGKVEEGETIEDAAIRELEEEIKVRAKTVDLEKAGRIKFFFEGQDKWNQEMNIFLLNKWEGEPEETDEMSPKWHEFKNIPYESMWVDDSHWLPKVLSGEKVEGEFYFSGDGSKLDRFELRVS